MDKDTLTEAKEAFDRASEAESHNHDAWLDDFRFARLAEQWPLEARKQRERDGRPCLTINRLPSFIRQVTNDARQNKPQIKTHPVGDGADQATSEILNGLIRNIEYTSKADIAYDTALDHAVTGGFGYLRVSTDYASDDSFEQDIKIERVANPLTVRGDPDNHGADSAEWNSAFVTDMWRKADFEKKWKDAQSSDFPADDRNDQWIDGEQIRVAEWWTRDEMPVELLKLSDGMVMAADQYEKIKDLLDAKGVSVVGQRTSRTHKVTQRIISGAEVLETNKWAGRFIPIVPVYGDEVLLEGKRHLLSLVRHAKDPQRMFNYWRTASTELVALAPRTPFIGPKGAFDTDASKWATANTQSHSYIEFDGPQAPQRQPFAGPPAGALQEAMNAADDMKSIMGIFDASLGARSNETSGRAIMARQREGDVSTFNYIDNLSRAIRHAGAIIVDLIPKVYDTERIVRVIHEDGTNEAVQVNAPFQMSPQQQADQAQQQQESNEQMMSITKLYDLTTGKYDVTCDVGPSFTTKRQEAAQQMTEFVRAFPAAAQIAGDLMAKNFDWPGADELAKRFKAMLPPQAQGANPQAQQLQQQMQQMDGQAREAIGQMQQQMAQLSQALEAEKQKSANNEMKAQLDAAKLQLEDRKLSMEGEKMGIERIKAMSELANSGQIIDASGMPAKIPTPPKVKRIQLVGPSGAMYEGQMTEEDQQAPPNGQ